MKVYCGVSYPQSTCKVILSDLLFLHLCLLVITLVTMDGLLAGLQFCSAGRYIIFPSKLILVSYNSIYLC